MVLFNKLVAIRNSMVDRITLPLCVYANKIGIIFK